MNNTTSSETPSVEQVISIFKANIMTGQNWFLALLEVARYWPVSEENYAGLNYSYIISGEALDIIQIAERLLTAAGELVAEEAKIAFLLHSELPRSKTAGYLQRTRSALT